LRKNAVIQVYLLKYKYLVDLLKMENSALAFFGKTVTKVTEKSMRISIISVKV
jgi:hypothetical protein